MKNYYKYFYFSVVLIISFYILYLHIFKQIQYLISSRYFLFNIVMILFLIAIFITIFTFSSIKSKKIPNLFKFISDLHIHRNNIRSSLLVFGILLLAMFLPLGPLSPRTALGVSSDNKARLNFQPRELELISPSGNRIDTANYSLYDWVRILATETNVEKFSESQISLIGFVLPDQSKQQDSHFLISRYVITCCAVDAVPVSLPVVNRQSNSDKPLLDDPSTDPNWYQIEGKFVYNEEDSRLEILVSEFKIVEPPDDPYQ